MGEILNTSQPVGEGFSMGWIPETSSRRGALHRRDSKTLPGLPMTRRIRVDSLGMEFTAQRKNEWKWSQRKKWKVLLKKKKEKGSDFKIKVDFYTSFPSQPGFPAAGQAADTQQSLGWC